MGPGPAKDLFQPIQNSAEETVPSAGGADDISFSLHSDALGNISLDIISPLDTVIDMSVFIWQYFQTSLFYST